MILLQHLRSNSETLHYGCSCLSMTRAGWSWASCRNGAASPGSFRIARYTTAGPQRGPAVAVPRLGHRGTPHNTSCLLTRVRHTMHPSGGRLSLAVRHAAKSNFVAVKMGSTITRHHITGLQGLNFIDPQFESSTEGQMRGSCFRTV